MGHCETYFVSMSVGTCINNGRIMDPIPNTVRQLFGSLGAPIWAFFAQNQPETRPVARVNYTIAERLAESKRILILSSVGAQLLRYGLQAVSHEAADRGGGTPPSA